ncbi:MAG: dockerin type I repeat-containing protein [Planctomycetes bacterium]|nr:dockerin type I repeat-containing protein [Planctomycetota bacterium]
MNPNPMLLGSILLLTGLTIPTASVLAGSTTHEIIDGVVNVDGIPRVLDGVLTEFVTGTSVSTSGVSLADDIALAPEWVQNRLIKYWPSGLIGMDRVLTQIGDGGSATIEIEGVGTLFDTFFLESLDPYTIHHTFSGDEVTLPEYAQAVLPHLKRDMQFTYAPDGSFTGEVTLAIDVPTLGGVVETPVSYAGTFVAASPGVALPATFVGAYQIDTIDPATGAWTGSGTREQARLTREIIDGNVVVNGSAFALDGSLTESVSEGGRVRTRGNIRVVDGVEWVPMLPDWLVNRLIKAWPSGLIGGDEVLTQVGDGGSVSIEIGGVGLLTDDFIVESIDPVTIRHTFSGSETFPVGRVYGELRKSDMSFTWSPDGTVVGQVTLEGYRPDLDQWDQYAATYTGSFAAVAPHVMLPATFTGDYQVDDYDESSGDWAGSGLRASAPSSDPQFVRGDANGDGSFNIGDAVFLLTYVFGGGVAPSCLDAGDANDDGALNVGDPITILSALFSMGTTPLPPFPDCGSDPTSDALPCTDFAPCP